MNPKYLWPVGCVGALVVGWSVGYMMGGAPGAGDHAGSRAETPSRPALRLTESTRKDSPTAVGGEEGGHMQTILGALRDPDYMRRQHDIYDAVLKMPPGEFASALALTLKLPMRDRSQVLHLLVKRWAETDPHAAADFVLALEPKLGNYLARAVTAAWADTDPQAAKQWTLSLPPGINRSEAFSGVMWAIGSKDPEAVLQFILTLPPPGLPPDLAPTAFGNIFSAWSSKDPVGAGGKALAMPPGNNRNAALHAVVSSWAQTDPRAAIAWAAQIPEPGTRRAAISGAYGDWAGSDAKAARAAVLALPPGEERSRLLAVVANRMQSSDPQTASTLIMQLRPGSARDSAISDIASAWARTDVAAAADWVAQLPDSKSRRNAEGRLAYQWAQTEPRAAADYLMKNQPPSSHGDHYAFASVVQTWAQMDSQQAIEWARKLPDEKLRGEMLAYVVGTLAQQEPQSAAALFAELPANRQGNVANNLASSWSRDDPDAASAWALQLPGNDVRMNAVSGIAYQMAQLDLEMAAAWIERLPLGAFRDAGVRIFAHKVAESDPESAVARAATISDEESRTFEIKEIVSTWLRNDEDAATRWITQSTLLDEKTKQRLLKKN